MLPTDINHEALRAVEDLNDITYLEDSTQHYKPYEFCSDGDMSCIKFMGEIVWDTENDDQRYTEDGRKLPIYSYCLEQGRVILKDLILKMEQFNR